MKKVLPNEREAIILNIAIRGEKYGREIRDEYQRRTGGEMPLGSLYTTLDRMEDKGFFTTRLGDPNPARGGTRRKYYKLSADGLKALNNLRELVIASKGGLANVTA